jgi:hypothetical protein
MHACRKHTKQPDLEDFRPLIGNLKLTLVFLALTWTLAAFGEEMVYRGYLMNRVADLFNRTRRTWIISLIVVHVAFGLAHAYQRLDWRNRRRPVGTFTGSDLSAHRAQLGRAYHRAWNWGHHRLYLDLPREISRHVGPADRQMGTSPTPKRQRFQDRALEVQLK